MSLLLLLQFGFALHPYYGTGRGQAHRPKEYNYSRPFGGGEFRPFGRCPISPLLPLCRCEENWRAAANKWLTQRHREGSAHNPLPIPQEVRRLSCTESIRDRKEECSEHKQKGSGAVGYGPCCGNAGDDERCVCFRRRAKRQPAAP